MMQGVGIVGLIATIVVLIIGVIAVRWLISRLFSKNS